MEKINFQNGKTPLNDTNLNKMQDNIENAIGELTTETITNENGTAVKFSDGTMIVYQNIDYALSCNVEWGALYSTGEQSLPNFPVEFINKPTITKTANTLGYVVWLCSLDGTTTNAGNYELVRPTSTAEQTITGTISVVAIGKWK